MCANDGRRYPFRKTAMLPTSRSSSSGRSSMIWAATPKITASAEQVPGGSGPGPSRVGRRLRERARPRMPASGRSTGHQLRLGQRRQFDPAAQRAPARAEDVPERAVAQLAGGPSNTSRPPRRPSTRSA